MKIISQEVITFQWKGVTQTVLTSIKVNNGNTRTMYEIYSNLQLPGVFIVNFKQILQIALLFSLLTSNN